MARELLLERQLTMVPACLRRTGETLFLRRARRPGIRRSNGQGSGNWPFVGDLVEVYRGQVVLSQSSAGAGLQVERGPALAELSFDRTRPSSDQISEPYRCRQAADAGYLSINDLT